MSSAAMRTRVATRSAGAEGEAEGGGADVKGGRVIRGVAVGATVGVGEGSEDSAGPAVTGVV